MTKSEHKRLKHIINKKNKEITTSALIYNLTDFRNRVNLNHVTTIRYRILRYPPTPQVVQKSAEAIYQRHGRCSE